MSHRASNRRRAALAVTASGLLLLASPVPSAGDDEPPASEAEKPAPPAATPPAGGDAEKPAQAEGKSEPAPGPARDPAPGDAIEVAPPPFSEGVFPCTDCHTKGDTDYDHTRRELSEHDFKFNHDPRHRWCFDCHDGDDRDMLHLASGEKIPFTESYKLCGQCHGSKYRDWLVGVHGRRTGNWDGKKKYLLCVNCHWPHDPKFQPLKPEPPPVRPERLRQDRTR